MFMVQGGLTTTPCALINLLPSPILHRVVEHLHKTSMFTTHFNGLCAAVSHVPAALQFSGEVKREQASTLVVLILACLSALMVFKVTEIVLLLVGIYTCSYFVMQSKAEKGSAAVSDKVNHPRRKRRTGVKAEQAVQRGRHLPSAKQDSGPAKVMRCLPPTFANLDWEGEVMELLGQIVPTVQDDGIAEGLAQLIQKALCTFIPEVEVSGFSTGSLMCSKAFGVAVPDVDIVVTVPNEALIHRLRSRFSHGGLEAVRNDPRKLQKSAIRACTDELVLNAGFKFRRSAFRREEPRVTILAPPSLGVASVPIALNMTVNALTPVYCAALLTECGCIDPRARELIVLVKHWARDRGISHASNGHLSPFAWSVLTMYFLQVGVDDGNPLLPPFQKLKDSSSAVERRSSGGRRETYHNKDDLPAGKTTAGLFKNFFRFYHHEFDWRKEAASVQSGRRGTPPLSLPLHIVLHEDGQKTEVGPSIQDPFRAQRNLATSINALGVKRLREELARADRLCCNQSSLSEVLEPWFSAENDNSARGKGQEAVGGESQDEKQQLQ